MATTKTLHIFLHTDEFGRRRKTTYRLTEEDARERLKDPEIVPGTSHVIVTPDDTIQIMGGGIRTMPPGRG